MSQPEKDDSAVFSSTGLAVRLAIMLTVLGVYGILAVLTTACMLYRCVYKRAPFLSGRSIPLVVAQAVSGTFVGLASLVCTAMGEYPCALRLWTLYSGVLPWLAVIAARAVQRCVLTLPCPQQSPALRSGLTTANQVYACHMEHIAGDANTVSCGTHAFCVASRPGTGSVTVHTMSEFDFSSRNSQSTLSGTYNASPMLSIHQPRSGRWVTTNALLTFVVAFGGSTSLIALVANVKLPAYRPQAACPGDGWDLWLAYSVTVALAGLVFPVLTIRIWKTVDIYGIRVDILLCMFSAQAAAVLYALWITAMSSIRVYVSEMFVLWLAVLFTHISSVCIPLWKSHKLHTSAAIHKPHIGLTNTYKGSHLRRSLYSSLFSEFCQMMQSRTQREAFLRFTVQYYRSTIPEFLHSFQLLKYKTIEALWQEQNDRMTACCRHHQRRSQNCGCCCCHHNSETAPQSISNNALTDGGSCRCSGAQYVDGCAAACLTSPHKHSKSSIQMIADTWQSSHDTHPLAALVPITKGIFESAMAVLPPGSIDQTTQFPEAVKSAFSNFVHTFFDKGSCLSINIPRDMVNQVQLAVDQNNVVLSVLDGAKDEVLFLMCTDVFTGYRRRIETRNG